MQNVHKSICTKSRRFCSVPHCSTYCTKDISLHSFPKDPKLCSIWKVVLRIGKPISKYMLVCSQHFTDADFYPGTNKNRRLKNNVIPSQRIPDQIFQLTKKKLIDRSVRSWLQQCSIESMEDENMSVETESICSESNMDIENDNLQPISKKEDITFYEDKKTEYRITEDPYETTLFKCEECRLSFKKNEYLRHHLSQKHNLNFDDCEELSFSTFEEFQNWLSCEQKTNNVEYEKLTGVQRTSNDEISKIYFNCVRSGKTPIPIPNGTRAQKSQGSKKLDRYCTSQIIVDRHIRGKCEVKYYKTHYGHDNDIEHLKISKSDKDVIDANMIVGLSTEQILDNSRGKISSDEIHYSDIITKKDTNNIKQLYKVNLGKSDDKWIKKVEKQETECLKKSDLILNNIQVKMLKKFRSNIVCIENTDSDKAQGDVEVIILVIDPASDSPLKPPREKIVNEIETNLSEVISNINNASHSEEQLHFLLEESKKMKTVINIKNEK